MSSLQKYVELTKILGLMEKWNGIKGCYFWKDFQKEHGIHFRNIGIHPYSVDVEKLFPGIAIDLEMAKELDAIESRRSRDDCCGESEWYGLKDLMELAVKVMGFKALQEWGESA